MELMKQEVSVFFFFWWVGARRVPLLCRTSPGISKHAPAWGRMSRPARDSAAAPLCEPNSDKGIPTLLSERIPER